MLYGFAANTIKRPDNLLEACCFWDECQGGTIHQFMHRLSFEKPRYSKGNYYYSLQMDNMVDIGDACYPAKQDPKVEDVALRDIAEGDFTPFKV